MLETVVKQRTVEIMDVDGNEQMQTPRRSFSGIYSLPLPNGAKFYVCKIMFLSTLGTKSDSMITALSLAKRRSYEDNICPTEDHRCGTYLEHKCDDEVIRLHINSYQPSISHYRRINAPNRRYLNPELSIKQMDNNFIANNENFKISYRKFASDLPSFDKTLYIPQN